MIDPMRFSRPRSYAAVVALCCLSLGGCTRPDGFDSWQGAAGSRLDVAPLYSEAYSGRVACLGCQQNDVDSELVFYRERRTGAPAGYQLNQRYLDGQGVNAETSHHGNWLIMQNGASANDHPVYRLQPDDSALPALLLEQTDADTLVARDSAERAGAAKLQRTFSPAMGDLSVTEADSGVPVTIQVGQTLTVSLAAEAGERFGWRLIAPPEGSLEPLGSPMRVAAGQIRQQVDANSTAVWQFMGRYPGDVALRFELESLTQPQATSARVVRYEVHVQ